MAIKINYSNKKYSKTNSNSVFFFNDKFNIDNLKKDLSNSEFTYVKDLLKTADLKKNYLLLKSVQKRK